MAASEPADDSVITMRFRRQSLLGRLLRRVCLLMGPVYVKFGQIMSTRSDLLPPAVIDQLRSLQDDVPAMGRKHVTRLLDKAYGHSFSQVFRTVDPTPVASASIAQVHRAELADGTQVAVKLVKRGVARSARIHLALITMTWRVLHLLVPPIRRHNVPARVAKIAELLRRQVDMRIELENMVTLGRNLNGHPFVTIPAAYPELCRHNVLVMDFVDGVKLADFAILDVPPAKLAKRLQELFFTMLYLDGVCHGDLHPGNMFLTPQGGFILIDFGITVYLTEADKWGLASFNYAATRHQWDLAADRFTRHFVVDDSDLMSNPDYVRRLKEVLRHHYDTVSDQWSGMAFFKDINAALHSYGAAYTSNFVEAEFGLLSCEGVIAQIDPGFDIWENARAFADRYSPFLGEDMRRRLDAYFGEHTPNSMALRSRAAGSLVATTHLDRYFFPAAYPLFVASAEGARLVDVDDNVYVDLSCGYGPHILGRGHPVVREALVRASESCNINALGHEAEVELAETLVAAFPGADKAILSNSGTESVIHALRLCRTHRPKARKIAKFEGHYHGFSDQAMVSSWFRVDGVSHEPTPIAGCPGTPSAVVRDTIVLQFGHPHSLELLRRNAYDIAGVVVEPMSSSEGGIDIAFLSQLREECTRLGIPLVFDEVVSGFRVAYGGVQTITGVTPDLTVLGKIIGGGLPLGAVIGAGELVDLGKTTGDPFRDYEERAFLGGTLSGNNVACRTGLAVLEYLKGHPDVYVDLQRRTDALAHRMRDVAAAHDVPMRLKAAHSMFTLAFTYRDGRYFRELLHGANFKATLAIAYWMRMHGVYLPELHGFLISAAHTDDDVAFVAEAFDKSLGEMVAAGFFTS